MEQNELLKQCTKCGQYLSLDHFHKDRSKLDGLYPSCALCRRHDSKAYYQANTEKIKQRRQAYRQANAKKFSAKWRLWYEQNKARHIAKNKAYYQANTEKIKQRRQAYRQANTEKIKQQGEAYRQANTEKIKQQQRAYRQANPDKVRQQKHAWRAANKEKVKASQTAWKSKNPERFKELHRESYKRHADKRRAYYAARTATTQVKLKIKAARAVQKARVQGLLATSTNCEQCGKKAKLQAHHDSYLPAHWLKVRHLCASCHQTWHLTNEPIIPSDPEISMILRHYEGKVIPLISKIILNYKLAS